MRTAYLGMLLVLFCYRAGSGQLFDNSGQLVGLQGVFEGITRMRESLQQNINQLNRQIHDNVRGYFSNVERFHEDLRKKIGANMPSISDTNNGNAIVISSNGGATIGASRMVYSGYTPNGEPYYRDSERKVKDGILHHFERVYDSKEDRIKEYRYTLDLKDPDAKPVEVPATAE